VLRIVIPGIARPKQRSRSTRTGHHYTPAATVNQEAWIRQCAVEQIGQPCLAGAVIVRIAIRVAVPQSKSKKWKEDALTGRVWPTTKPDVDNTVKAIFDAFNGIVWKDDVQIVEAHIYKCYAEKPSTVIEIEEIGA